MKKEDIKGIVREAMRLRAAEPWKKLNDSQMFGVSMPDGDVWYGCILGNSGMEYGLSIYPREDGLKSFVNSISGILGNPDYKTRHELMCQMSYINISFDDENIGTLLGEWIEAISEALNADNKRIKKKNAWPFLYQIYHGEMYQKGVKPGFEEGTEIMLRAAVEIAAKLKGLRAKEIAALGFKDEYIPVEGGMEIPLLTPNVDGTFKWGMMHTPAIEEQEYEVPEFENEEVISKLKNLRQVALYQCRLIHSPARYGSEEESYYPLVFLMVRAIDEYAVTVMASKGDPTDEFDLLDAIGEQMIKDGFRPKTLTVCDDHTEALLTDFCEKTGIRLNTARNLPSLDSAWAYLLTALR